LAQNALAKNTVTFAEEGNEVRVFFDSTVNVEASQRAEQGATGLYPEENP
jgi:hypothetical protein